AEDGIRDFHVTGVQTCALPIFANGVTGESLLQLRPAMQLNRCRKFQLVNGVQQAEPENLGLIRIDGVEDEIQARLGNHPWNDHRSEERRVGKEGSSRWTPDAEE